MIRPDFSQFVVHFTSDRPPYCVAEEQNADRKRAATELSAFDKLQSILQSQDVWATTMPWVNRKAVCFTECTWGSLLDHAAHYSPFGIGFSKPFLFACGGGPAFYMRADLFEKQVQNGGFHDHLKAFVTPFWPFYAPYQHRQQHYGGKAGVDYTHEREWRVPHDLKFKPEDVAFVIVDRYEHMAQTPKEIKDAIGREKFLIMDIYRKVEQLWPTHLTPDERSS
jgi:hypothetical protein